LNGGTACQMNQLFILLGFLIVLIHLCRWLYRRWLLRWMNRSKPASLSRRPRVLKPKTERDCPVCQQHRSKATPPARYHPSPGAPAKVAVAPGRRSPPKGLLARIPCASIMASAMKRSMPWLATAHTASTQPFRISNLVSNRRGLVAESTRLLSSALTSPYTSLFPN